MLGLIILEVGCQEENTVFYDLFTFNLNTPAFEERLNTLSQHFM